MVENILIQDNYTLDVVLNTNPNMRVGMQDETEIVVLEDVKLLGGMLQSQGSKQVELRTETPLQPSRRYSLLTLSGTEGSIDFETPSAIE